MDFENLFFRSKLWLPERRILRSSCWSHYQSMFSLPEHRILTTSRRSHYHSLAFSLPVAVFTTMTSSSHYHSFERATAGPALSLPQSVPLPAGTIPHLLRTHARTRSRTLPSPPDPIFVGKFRGGSAGGVTRPPLVASPGTQTPTGTLLSRFESRQKLPRFSWSTGHFGTTSFR